MKKDQARESVIAERQGQEDVEAKSSIKLQIK